MSISLLAREDLHAVARQSDDKVIMFPPVQRLRPGQGPSLDRAFLSFLSEGDERGRSPGPAASLLPLAPIVSITATMLCGILWP